MIYEYAFHPDVWKEIFDKKELLRSVIRNIGIGKPCILSNYPDVCALLYKKFMAEKSVAGNNPKKIAKIDETLNLLAEVKSKVYGKTIMRSNTAAWSDNFVDEHARHPFHTILSPTAKKQTNICQDVAWLQDLDSPFFNHPHGTIALRNAQELSNAVKPLLQNAKKITFVDPYFCNGGSDDVYDAYFDSICTTAHIRSTSPMNVLIASRWPHDKKNIPLTKKEFENRCAHIFRNIDDNKVKIEIYAIQPHNTGQEFHNRYILTDIGGVLFGHGTGASQHNSNHSYDQISLLPAINLAYWLNAFKPKSSYFIWPNKPTINIPPV